MTNGERLQAKIEKEQARIKALQDQLKAEKQVEKKRLENIAKLESLSPEFSIAIQDILTKSDITLPQEKQIVIATSDAGITASIVDVKLAKKAGSGGAKAITYEGEQISWAKLCELKGVARTPGGSAHRDVYNKAGELHNSIPHDCAIDGGTYPIS